MGTTYLMYEVIPILCAAVLWYRGRDRQALLCAVLISQVIFIGTFYAGRASQEASFEIWNGQVTAKHRENGSYEESYSCNCTRDSKGNSSCSTCYETRYTVTWSCDSTIGGFPIDRVEGATTLTWSASDPKRYELIDIGDPVSKTHVYKDYIKASPSSLFSTAKPQYQSFPKGYFPKYPNDIYDIYHVDRVLAVGFDLPNNWEWNDKLSEVLKTLGPKKQVNAVIVLVKDVDHAYFQNLQAHWKNGAKNDVVLVIGMSSLDKSPVWADVMALAQDMTFQSQLRTDIAALPAITADGVIGVLSKDISTMYTRKRMHDFQYLEADIDPPLFLTIISLFLIAIIHLIALNYAIKQKGTLYVR